KSSISAGFSYQKVRILRLLLLLAVIAQATAFFFVYCDAIPEFAPIRCLLAIYTIMPYNRLTAGLVPAAPAVWIFHAAVFLLIIAIRRSLFLHRCWEILKREGI
ncbi:MAG: hypothetical protein RR063_10780, partial [Anaerovoracaceae bacterium]